jgi:hypothetical protein
VKAIWKYQFRVDDEVKLENVPYPDPVLLSVQDQSGIMTAWLLVDPTSDIRTEFILHIRGTGHEIEEDLEGRYFTTVQQGSLVWHVFSGGVAQ